MTQGEKTDLKILGTLFAILFIAIMAFILTGCNPNSGNPDSSKTESLDNSNNLVLDSNSRYFNKQYRVYTLGSCEYIVVGHGDMQWGSHKGDCKNPVHKIDTTEKHFDCTIQDIEPGNEELKYMCTTECGIVFYTNSRYKIGDTIKNFKSPKHK